MLNNFPILNSSKTATLGNHAGIPGTGPTGAACSGCASLQRQGARAVCGKFQEITHRKGKPIDTSTAACRYYVARQARLAGTAEEGSAA